MAILIDQSVDTHVRVACVASVHAHHTPKQNITHKTPTTAPPKRRPPPPLRRRRERLLIIAAAARPLFLPRPRPLWAAAVVVAGPNRGVGGGFSEGDGVAVLGGVAHALDAPACGVVCFFVLGGGVGDLWACGRVFVLPPSYIYISSQITHPRAYSTWRRCT